MNYVSYILAAFFILFGVVIALQHKKCTIKNMMVLYRRMGGAPTITKIIKKDGIIVIPFFQGCLELSDEPLTMSIDLYNVKTKDGNTITVSFIITTKFSNKIEILQNAIDNLAGYSMERIINKIREVATNYLVDKVTASTISDIGNRRVFMPIIISSLRKEFYKIGINLLEIVMTNIHQGN